jgi:uncharacterized repeat protein (TIGR01451 family)
MQKNKPQKLSKQNFTNLIKILISFINAFLQTITKLTTGIVIFINKKITKFQEQKKNPTNYKNIKHQNIRWDKIKTPLPLEEQGDFRRRKKQHPTYYQYLKLFTPKLNLRSWKWKRFTLSMIMTFILTLQFTGINWWQLPKPALAAASIQIEPLTWDMVGLDSNKPPTEGPQDYLVGSRVCNMSTNEPVRDVTVKYKTDGVNNGFTFINIATDTLFLDYLPPNDPTIPGTIADAVTGPYIFDNDANRLLQKTKYEINFTPTNCADFYVNLDITRTSAAFNTYQRYYMEATAIDPAGNLLGPIRTPQPRQIYITKLISQARNTVSDFYCDTPSGAGQRGNVNVAVGDVMVCTAIGHTATAYPQLSFTANFPNIVFQILDVNTSYSNPTGGENSAVYADGCGWVQDPTSPDYYRSPTNCAGAGWPGQYVNNSGGEGTGLNVVTNYTVKVLSKPPSGSNVKVSNIVLDFSGGSFHYNADYGTDICPTTNCLNFDIDDSENSDLSIVKSHVGNFTLGANQYTMTITDNANSVNAKDVKFYDTLPVGYSFSSPLIANSGLGQDGEKWYCTITDPIAFGGQNRSVVCNFTNGTFLNKTDDFILDGSTQTLIFNVNVEVPPASTNSTNVACVKAINDINPNNDCDNDPTTIIFGPNIKLTKDDNNPSTPPFGAPDEIFVAGSTHTYNFLVEKTTDAYNVDGPLTLVDTLPTGVNFVSSNNNDGWSCTESGQTVVCSRATGLTGTTADPSSKTTFAMTVSVGLNAVDMDPVTSGIQVINTATVTSGSLDVNPNDNTDTQTNTVTIPAPDLTIDKTDFDFPFITGTSNNIYLFTIRNKNTPGTITTTGDINFTDVLPAHLNLVSAGNAPGSSGWTCTPAGPTTAPSVPTAIPLAAPTYNNPGTSVGVTVNCTNSNPLPPGFSTQIQIVVAPNYTGTYTIGNRATVTTAGETIFDFGDDPANGTGDANNICKARVPEITSANCDEEITNVRPAQNNALDVATFKTAPATVAPEGGIEYIIKLHNLSSANNNVVENGRFFDVVPDGITITGAVCNVLDTGNPTNSNRCCGATTGTGIDHPVTSIVDNVVTCNNYSLRKANNIVDQIQIKITGTVKPGVFGNINNTAIISPPVGVEDENPTNNRSTVTTFIPGADLSITKGTNFSNFTVGADSTYTLTVKNESPITAPNNFPTSGLITVRDVLPTQLDFVSASGPEWFCSYNATTRLVLCTTTHVLAPQEISEIDLVVKPNAISSVTNSASVQYGGDPLDDKKAGFYTAPIGGTGVIDDANGNGLFDPGDDPNSNDFDNKTTTIIAPNVDLSITKTAQTAFELGQQATYRLNITNHNVGGATPALSPITITDQLPPGISFIYATTVTGSPWVCNTTSDALPDNNSNGIVDAGDGNGVNDGFETVSCNRYTNIAPNETATLDLNVLVTASVDTAAPITNQVRVTSSSDFCLDFSNTNCQVNNRASVDVSVTPSSDLAIFKRAISRTAQINPPQFLVGNTESFEITVVNNGPSNYGGNITFTDVLNSNFTFVPTGSGGDGFTCSASGQTVTCSKATGLTAGQTAKVIINVLVADPSTPAPIADTGADVGGDNVTNTATIDLATLTAANDKDNTNNSSTVIIDLEDFETDLVLQKDDGDGEYALTPSTHRPPADPLFDEPLLEQNRQYFTTSVTAPPGGGSWQGSYTFEVLNKGPAIALAPVTITDTLPIGLTYEGSFGTNWTCSAVGQNLTCTYQGNLAVGVNTGVEVIVNVNPNLLPSQGGAGVVTNSATVTSGTPEANTADNTNSEITIIREAADLSVTKTR